MPLETIHRDLPPLRRVNARTGEYAGACPRCGGNDRFHVWTQAQGNKPAGRFWCRHCGFSGLLSHLDSTLSLDFDAPTPDHTVTPANPDHIPYYRELYAQVALWSHQQLWEEYNPEPLHYLRHERRLDDATIQHYMLGTTLRDPQALVTHIQHAAPHLLAYGEAAGVLTTNDQGVVQTHWNLLGRIVLPYIANGQVVDLRTRHYSSSKKGYKSLRGGYEDRGAVFPMGWDTAIAAGSDTILLTEAEFKAMAALQAYHAGDLAYPTLGQAGLSVFRDDWCEPLASAGVTTVVLVYDSQNRLLKEGQPVLTPEEMASLRHGQRLHEAGFAVRVLQLPRSPAEAKGEIDTYLATHSPHTFQRLVDTAPDLLTFWQALPAHLLKAADLPVPDSYPRQRLRPARDSRVVAPLADTERALSLHEARTDIAQRAERHATNGQGFLVLAHPPGTGKGYNVSVGLKQWAASGTTASIVWAALRKDQLHDQQGLNLIALHGRSATNCRKIGEAAMLAQKGYNVREGLCETRCPFVSRCPYLQQFQQYGDFFAPQSLLQAPGWWQEAGIVVLDEFDITQLTRAVPLRSNDIAAMHSSHAAFPAVQRILQDVGLLLGSCLDRTISGAIFLRELAQQSHSSLDAFRATLEQAISQLPPTEERQRLPQLPSSAGYSDFQRLPLNYTHVLLDILQTELQRHLRSERFTSRLECNWGTLTLFLRNTRLIAQLSRPEQPKLILDATINTRLLHAVFPHTPIQVEQPRLVGAARVIQVISRDWAKSTLRGKRIQQWIDDVASHIRPERPTLVVCTKQWADTLRQALADRNITQATVAHYGSLRGSNAYKGYDVVLAQVYHPNLEDIRRVGRSLFADDPIPLDERVTTTATPLVDATGQRWSIEVPTFVDSRLAALLEHAREAEMTQCALRGRPFDHPQSQITLLFGLPLPGLPPTTIVEAHPTPNSNAGRAAAALASLYAAAQVLRDQGKITLSVDDLAQAAPASVVTVRKYFPALAARLRMRVAQQRRWQGMPRGGRRMRPRSVLLPRGRSVPSKTLSTASHTSVLDAQAATPVMMDQAPHEGFMKRVIRHQEPHPRRRRRYTCVQKRENSATEINVSALSPPDNEGV